MADAQGASGAPTELSLEQALLVAQEMQIEGKYELAEKVYRRILEVAPEEPNALHFFGVMRHMQGRNDEALELIRRACALVPEHAGVWINLGNVLLESSQFDEAIDAYKRASDLAPNDELVYNNLGLLQARRNNLALAEAAYQRATTLAPRAGFILANHAHLLMRMGRYEEGIHLAIQASNLAPKDPRARRMLCLGYGMVGKQQEAQQVLRDWLEIEPGNPEALHMLAAAGGMPAPERASDAYIAHEFDRFAGSFDARLQSLDYKAPGLCAAALKRALGSVPPAGPQPAGVVLDAGCGTGLCAAELRPLASRLEGVDLSQGMLDRAQLRGSYDLLDKAELHAYIDARPARWDTIVSADTLCYFGELAGVLHAAARALRPGGHLVFSVEALEDGEGPGFRLNYHGRYAHHKAYLERCLRDAGLALHSLDSEKLRVEVMRPVEGWIVVARKPAL